MEKNSEDKSETSFSKSRKILIVVENGDVSEVYLSPKLAKKTSIIRIDHDVIKWNSQRSMVKVLPCKVLSNSLFHKLYPFHDLVSRFINATIANIWGFHISRHQECPVRVYKNDRPVVTYKSIKETAKKLEVSTGTIRDRLESGKELNGFYLQRVEK